MSEMNEPIWALISERGCEAAGITYEEAHKLMLKREREGLHALCIITDRAARFVPRVKRAAQDSAEPATAVKS